MNYDFSSCIISIINILWHTLVYFIGVGRFRILGGARFRILGGARFRILGGERGAKFPAGT